LRDWGDRFDPGTDRHSGLVGGPKSGCQKSE
jgi:hypothetical protein